MLLLLVIKSMLVYDDLHRSASKPPLGTPRKIGQGCRFHSFTTNTYKMHFLESPSGIKVGIQRRGGVNAVRAAVKCSSNSSYFLSILACAAASPSRHGQFSPADHWLSSH